MAWFRIALSVEQLQIVSEERMNHPHGRVRERMWVLSLWHAGLTRDIPSTLDATNDKDQVDTYDLLFRLKTFDEGTLSETTISGTPKKEEDWTLDALGNWTSFIQKTNGTTDLNQTRAHNDEEKGTGVFF